MSRVPAKLMLALLVAAGCSEGTDWRPVTLAELKGQSGYENRTGPGGDFLSATGDFNGDEIADKVTLMRSDSEDKAQFMVVLGGDKGVFPVGGIRAEHIPKVGVVRVPAGVYQLACPWEDGAVVACEPRSVTFEKDAINIFGFHATGTYMYYVGGGFRDVGDSERVEL